MLAGNPKTGPMDQKRSHYSFTVITWASPDSNRGPPGLRGDRSFSSTPYQPGALACLSYSPRIFREGNGVGVFRGSGFAPSEASVYSTRTPSPITRRDRLARSKAADSRSALEGVRRFKSCSRHCSDLNQLSRHMVGLAVQTLARTWRLMRPGRRYGRATLGLL